MLFPSTQEQMAHIRKYPEKRLGTPTYSDQKVGIIIHLFALLFVIILFLLGFFLQMFNWTLYLLLFLPMAISSNLLNQFAVVEGGILCGSRFIAWNRVTSFQFVPIDIRHRFYGYSKEVNEGFELKIKTKIFATNCIVTSKEMKRKLHSLLNEHLQRNENQSVLEQHE